MKITDSLKQSLKTLNSDVSHSWPDETKGRAPHKPFLLLSILEGVEQGWIRSNRIELSQNLRDTFFSYWNTIFGENRKTKVSTPFTHLDNESFWTLIDKKYAEIEIKLFDSMKTQNGRQQIKEILLGEYFSPEAAYIISERIESNGAAWAYSVEADLLADKPFEAYKKSDGKRILTEKEIQKRDRGFSFAVRRHYNYHCAMCKTKILTPGGASLTEGAHIIPWSESYNDDPRNGLSLCRNHHWMFDRLLVTVNENFKVEVSPILLNNKNHVFGLDEIKGGSILLPDDKKFKPAVEAILNHNNRFIQYHEEI